MAKGQWSCPGPASSDAPIGKLPTGAQDQGEETVHNYCNVDTGLGGSGAVSTEMVNPFAHKPTGKRDGGL